MEEIEFIYAGVGYDEVEHEGSNITRTSLLRHDYRKGNGPIPTNEENRQWREDREERILAYIQRAQKGLHD